MFNFLEWSIQSLKTFAAVMAIGNGVVIFIKYILNMRVKPCVEFVVGFGVGHKGRDTLKSYPVAYCRTFRAECPYHAKHETRRHSAMPLIVERLFCLFDTLFEANGFVPHYPADFKGSVEFHSVI